jgi:ribosome-associated protein
MFADSMLQVTEELSIPDAEVTLEAIRAQGAGGQNVNKSSTAIQLRFDIANSSLPEAYKARLLKLRDRRITKEGVIVIKAQQYRSQEQNRADALARLRDLIRQAMEKPKLRKATRPTRSAVQRRVDAKKRHSQKKALRKPPKDW